MKVVFLSGKVAKLHTHPNWLTTAGNRDLDGVRNQRGLRAADLVKRATLHPRGLRAVVTCQMGTGVAGPRRGKKLAPRWVSEKPGRAKRVGRIVVAARGTVLQ